MGSGNGSSGAGRGMGCVGRKHRGLELRSLWSARTSMGCCNGSCLSDAGLVYGAYGVQEWVPESGVHCVLEWLQ
jgi:hypothetical protein